MKGISFSYQKKYLIMLGKEYLIKSKSDEELVYKKQNKIFKKTGKKPRVVVSFRNPVFMP